MKCDGWNNKYLEYLFCTLFALAASFGFAVDGAAQESASNLDWLTAKERPHSSRTNTPFPSI